MESSEEDEEEGCTYIDWSDAVHAAQRHFRQGCFPMIYTAYTAGHVPGRKVRSTPSHIIINSPRRG